MLSFVSHLLCWSSSSRWASALAIGMIVLPAPAMADKLEAAMGKALFDRLWTSAPASTQATDGLGPLFNARSCHTCHIRKSRGMPAPQQDAYSGARPTATAAPLHPSYVLRVGHADGTADSTYGRQLQTNAIQGHLPEAKVHFSWRPLPDTFKTLLALSDADAASLRMPRIALSDFGYGAMDTGTSIAGRLTPNLHGIGILQSIPTRTLESWADPDDADGDGISGRINWYQMPDGTRLAGRYGWKAVQPTIQHQSAAAFHNDIGLSTPIFPQHAGDCTSNQPKCLQGPHGDSKIFENLEVDRKILRLTSYYVKQLPAEVAKTPPHAEKGQVLLHTIGCTACHKAATFPDPATGTPRTPYTDLLVHDMGDALADGIGEGMASGREFRTAPLWGLSNALATGQSFLHDGRAHTLRDAVLWHGGEATASQRAFQALSKADQDALILYLSTL
jgi:CxxC motif-containing protein (DUF1111 family)